MYAREARNSANSLNGRGTTPRPGPRYATTTYPIGQAGEISEWVEGLCERQLLTVAYPIIHAARIYGNINDAIDKTVKECLLDTPMSTLMERFRRNLQLIAEADCRGAGLE